jgi:hypothetical protein
MTIDRVESYTLPIRVTLPWVSLLAHSPDAPKPFVFKPGRVTPAEAARLTVELLAKRHERVPLRTGWAIEGHRSTFSPPKPKAEPKPKVKRPPPVLKHGKVCPRHVELAGLRNKRGRCVGCRRDHNRRTRKREREAKQTVAGTAGRSAP